MLTPYPTFTERDMDEMWEANCAVIKKLLSQTSLNSSAIAGVAVCGHGKGLYLWGKAGRPVRNGIISTDTRALEIVERWKRDGTEGKAFQYSCQHVLPSQPVALLAWLREHEPETLEDVQWVFACKDYIRFRLTGEAWAELTDYSGANLVNLYTRQYDPQLLNLFGIEYLQSALPPLRNSTDVCGYITEEAAARTGLQEGTPVAGGMFDIDACALALGVVDPDHICMIAGTWSINEYLRQDPVIDGSVLMNSLFCLPEYYLVEESSPTSAGNLEWFIKAVLPELWEEKSNAGDSLYDELNDWVESVSLEEGCPLFLPFLMASNVHPNAKGSFIGLSNYHTRRHLVRSIYEGIAFSHKYHLDKLMATRLSPPETIHLAGGASRSPVWTQMFADVMQLPIESVQVDEAGALGCAMAAAVAVGEYGSLAEAARQMSCLSPAVQPMKAHLALYERKYAIYLQVISALDPVWNIMQPPLQFSSRGEDV
jgi:L-xylulokinase